MVFFGGVNLVVVVIRIDNVWLVEVQVVIG